MSRIEGHLPVQSFQAPRRFKVRYTHPILHCPNVGIMSLSNAGTFAPVVAVSNYVCMSYLPYISLDTYLSK